MEPLLLYPDPPPPVVTQGLDLAGYPWLAVSGDDGIERQAPDDGWSGAVVVAVTDPEAGLAMCRALQSEEHLVTPVLLVISADQVSDLDFREELFDDFIVLPLEATELDARLKQLFRRGGQGSRPELVEYGELALNLETYQAAIDGRPLDLRYKAYELRKYLASHPGKVFPREIMLSRVWG